MTDMAGQPGPTLPSLRTDRGRVEVLVIGRYFCDVVFSGLPALPEPGSEVWAESCSILPGGTYITAAALHRLQVSTAWACQFGTDPFSHYVRDAAFQQGMDPSAFVEVDAPLRNISVALSFDGERSFVSFAGPTEALSLAAVRQLRPRVIVRPGLGDPDDLARLLDAAHEIGAIVFLDPQSSGQNLRSGRLRSLLQYVDIFAPNDREALGLTGRDKLDTALLALLEAAPFVVVKRGANGAIAADRSGKVQVPALPVEAVETTGAGDCFNAGFVMAMLEGADAIGCLRSGNSAGGLSTMAPGSAGMPTRLQVDEARATYGGP